MLKHNENYLSSRCSSHIYFYHLLHPGREGEEVPGWPFLTYLSWTWRFTPITASGPWSICKARYVNTQIKEYLTRTRAFSPAGFPARGMRSFWMRDDFFPRVVFQVGLECATRTDKLYAGESTRLPYSLTDRPCRVSPPSPREQWSLVLFAALRITFPWWLFPVGGNRSSSIKEGQYVDVGLRHPWCAPFGWNNAACSGTLSVLLTTDRLVGSHNRRNLGVPNSCSLEEREMISYLQDKLRKWNTKGYIFLFLHCLLCSRIFNCGVLCFHVSFVTFFFSFLLFLICSVLSLFSFFLTQHIFEEVG